MSFHEFSNHRFTVSSMFEFSEWVREIICLMSFDEFIKHGFTILSTLEFSKRVQEAIF